MNHDDDVRMTYDEVCISVMASEIDQRREKFQWWRHNDVMMTNRKTLPFRRPVIWPIAPGAGSSISSRNLPSRVYRWSNSYTNKRIWESCFYIKRRRSCRRRRIFLFFLRLLLSSSFVLLVLHLHVHHPRGDEEGFVHRRNSTQNIAWMLTDHFAPQRLEAENEKS